MGKNKKKTHSNFHCDQMNGRWLKIGGTNFGSSLHGGERVNFSNFWKILWITNGKWQEKSKFHHDQMNRIWFKSGETLVEETVFVQLHKGHRNSKLKYRRFLFYLPCPFLLFPFHLLPSPVLPTGFSFCFFPDFLAIFTLLSSTNNNFYFDNSACDWLIEMAPLYSSQSHVLRQLTKAVKSIWRNSLYIICFTHWQQQEKGST